MPSDERFDTPDEHALVRSVLHGDHDSFATLINRYGGLVVSIVFKMMNRTEDREDLCQEVFLKVYEKLNTFRFQSKLSTWIGNIAFNSCINFIRKKKNLLLDDLNTAKSEDENDADIEIADTGTAPDELFLKKEALSVLKTGMENLTAVQRTVLHLFHNQEMTLEEISIITYLPVNTVKSHLFRARNNLKNYLLKELNR